MSKSIMHTQMRAKQLLLGILAATLSTVMPAFAQTDEVVYYHTDAIGSVRMITNQAGVDIGRFDFTPFGQPFGTQPAETRRFAGKELDADTGLDYFGARYLRAQSGRFTSVDPVMNIDAALTDPQRWNRYAYVGNRPLKLVDPDGRDWITLLFKAGQAVVRGGDVYSSVSGIVDNASTIFSLDANVGTSERLEATGGVVWELSGAGDIFAAAKGVGTLAGRGADFALSIAPKAGRAGGPGAGKRFSDATKDAARAESSNCVFCGVKTTKEPGPQQSNIDHAKAKSRGGSNTLHNAQNTCRTCNLQKGTMSTQEFLRFLFF